MKAIFVMVVISFNPSFESRRFAPPQDEVGSCINGLILSSGKAASRRMFADDRLALGSTEGQPGNEVFLHQKEHRDGRQRGKDRSG